MITIVNDFYNKLAKDIDKTYFPTVKYYRDNESNIKAHLAIENFSNGCSTYGKLIKSLSSACNEKEYIINAIVRKYI